MRNSVNAINTFKGRLNIAVMVMLCLGLLLAGLAPLPVRASNENLSGTAALAPLKPQLTATVIVPTSLGFCKNFNFHVTVINYGNAQAKNAHLLFRQFPGGFFSLVNIDQPTTTLDPYTEDISLGNLEANEMRNVNFVVYVPFQNKLHAEWMRKFHFNFSASYDYVPEDLLGRIVFLAGNGKILVQTSGFCQE